MWTTSMVGFYSKNHRRITRNHTKKPPETTLTGRRELLGVTSRVSTKYSLPPGTETTNDMDDVKGDPGTVLLSQSEVSRNPFIKI